jgi:transcription antitermination factor NusG
MSETRQRRPHSWAVLELTRLGERKAEEGSLVSLLRQILKLKDGHPVFVPCRTYTDGGRKVSVHLMQGYAFVGADGAALHLPSDQPYVKRMMSSKGTHGSRVLSVVPDSMIQKMESELSSSVSDGIGIGTYVSVSDGVYKGLNGEVIDVVTADDLIVVRFNMRSLDTLVSLPKNLASPTDRRANV